MNNPIVVVNSTPVMLLQKIGKLDLLQKLYNKIYIAEAVHQELIIDRTDKTNNNDFILFNEWIEIVKIQNDEARKTFVTSLHIGEVETMILALERSADLCVLDDLLARKHAKRLNLNIIGTLGVLITAKKLILIDAVKPLVDKLISEGMYISDELYKSVLSLTDEIPK
ncbi:MAG: DUF3368 domain-containing protein [Oscillospiraceae bacterium]|jgi:predicted nucleic acid-binding protein|nr:DUF3368 domain-containing protein [Oscillospiraceae bacterium]